MDTYNWRPFTKSPPKTCQVARNPTSEAVGDRGRFGYPPPCQQPSPLPGHLWARCSPPAAPLAPSPTTSCHSWVRCRASTRPTSTRARLEELCSASAPSPAAPPWQEQRRQPDPICWAHSVSVKHIQKQVHVRPPLPERPFPFHSLQPAASYHQEQRSGICSQKIKVLPNCKKKKKTNPNPSDLLNN